MKYRILILGLLLSHFLMLEGFSQSAAGKKRVAKPTSFLSQQWWLGFHLGANVSKANPSESYSVYSPVQSTETSEKKYESYNKIGFQAGMEFTYNYKSLFFSFIPNYRSQAFAYSNEYLYSGEDPENTLQLNYYIENQLNYIELPIIIKYEFKGRNIRPYVLIGGYYSFLIYANKNIDISGNDNASGGSQPFNQESISLGVTELFNSTNAGILGGVGFNYYVGNIRTSFDISYKYGLTTITNGESRYSENRLAGIGDVMDDISLNNISFNLGILFPLRFLSREFKSKN